MLIMPMGDIFIRTFDINASEYSYLVASYALGAFLSSIISFLYLDRFDRKTALVFLYSGFVLGTLLCGFASDYFMLLVLRFLTGGFGGVIGALAFVIVSDLYLFKERGKAMGVLIGAFSVASALGIPFGLYLAAAYNWRVPFIGLGCIGILVLLLIIWKFPSIRMHLNYRPGTPSFKRTVSLLINDNNQLNALLLGFVLVLGHFIIIPFIAPYMIRNVGFTQMDVTKIFLFGGISMVFSAPLAGRLTDRLGVNKIFNIFVVLSFIPTIAITHMTSQPIWVALIFTTMLFIFASSRMIPANTIITASVGQENRGSFMSMKSALQQLAIALASFISGMVVFINAQGVYERYNILGYVSVIVCLFCMYLITKLRVAKGN